jgi:hypothetical protein
VRVSREFKLYSLYFVTGLVVTFVRHGVRTHWTSFESIEQFFEYWLIYLIALAVFVGRSFLRPVSTSLGTQVRS